MWYAENGQATHITYSSGCCSYYTNTGVLISPWPNQEVNKLQWPNSNFCKPLKKISEGCPSNQVSAAALTSASDKKWRSFNCFFSRIGLRTYQHLCILPHFSVRQLFVLYCLTLEVEGTMIRSHWHDTASHSKETWILNHSAVRTPNLTVVWSHSIPCAHYFLPLT